MMRPLDIEVMSTPAIIGVSIMPACVGLRPFTTCRYIGMKVTEPNSAKPTIKPPAQEIAKTWLANRRTAPHDGMRRVGRYNLSDALAADRRQDRKSLRTHPTRRPHEDIFLPEQNGVISLPTILLRSPPPVQATVGAAAPSLLQRNSLPSTHIRCRTTARRLATATMARRIPRRRATRM